MTRKSRIWSLLIFPNPEANSTGKMRSSRIASCMAVIRWSSGMVPFSKNSSINSSLPSATSSTSASCAALASSASSAGIGPSLPLPFPPIVYVWAFIVTRSTTPVRLRSLPIGRNTGTTWRPKALRNDSSARSRSARSRSMRFTTMMRGISISAA